MEYELLKISKCARNNTYCENLDYYPRNYIKHVIKDLRGYDIFFESDYDKKDDDLIERIQGSDRFVCAGITRTIFPQAGKNLKNEWKFIINQVEDGYIQGIRIEECVR